MSVYIVIPKRKMLPLQDETVQPMPISAPSSVVVPPLNLSGLLIDTAKDWAAFRITNLADPTAAQDAATRAYVLAQVLTLADLDTAVEFIIDGGGAVIATGEKGHIRLPFAGTIISVALAADQSGSIVIDIWKDTLANFPPTNADSITASAPPTLSSDDVVLDSTLTGWTKTFNAGDFLAFNVDSCTTITRVTLTLVVRRS